MTGLSANGQRRLDTCSLGLGLWALETRRAAVKTPVLWAQEAEPRQGERRDFPPLDVTPSPAGSKDSGELACPGALPEDGESVSREWSAQVPSIWGLGNSQQGGACARDCGTDVLSEMLACRKARSFPLLARLCARRSCCNTASLSCRFQLVDVQVVSIRDWTWRGNKTVAGAREGEIPPEEPPRAPGGGRLPHPNACRGAEPACGGLEHICFSEDPEPA